MQKIQFTRPHWIPLLFTLAAVTLFITLSAWQLQRLEWKQQLLAGITEAQAKPALGLLLDPEESKYRRAAFTGNALNDKALRFIGQKSRGYVWLVPFKLDDSDQVVLVNLGWYPPEETPTMGAGTVNVTGILRPIREKRLFSPDNRPEQNLWFTEDLAAMQAFTGATLTPLILDKQLPSFRNDHLGYAITWFMMAVVAVVMFGVYHRKKPEPRQ